MVMTINSNGKVTAMDFGEAIRLLKAGKRVKRAEWLEPGQWLALQKPDAGSKMTAPYLYKTNQSVLVPWLPGQNDMLAEDWQTVD